MALELCWDIRRRQCGGALKESVLTVLSVFGAWCCAGCLMAQVRSEEAGRIRIV
ncbi:hypothetical protein BDN70DRAFT_881325 [Pholiota conissans]|uniref:Uncharacterized protein n=1 Tax=Pholiota conissans TaxID=109636 RepID=A0A9P5YY36_9AGAR|nr:hypothetical protein BDN70DRAFT_881325 [Pholiota conissans]